MNCAFVVNVASGHFLPYPYTLLSAVQLIGRRSRDLPFAYSSPIVLVLDPPLVRRAEDAARPIPHLYARPRPELPPNLCLYWSPGREFDVSMYLAETIIPWATEWLMYYELWHATGKWVGPEAPHGQEHPTLMPAMETEAQPVLRHRRYDPSHSLFHMHPYLIATRHLLMADVSSTIGAGLSRQGRAELKRVTG